MTPGYIALTYKFFQDGGQWVGACLELNTGTDADTLEQAREDIQLVVRDILEFYQERGELEEYLFQCGVVPQPSPVDPESILLEKVQLHVGAKDAAETQAGG